MQLRNEVCLLEATLDMARTENENKDAAMERLKGMMRGWGGGGEERPARVLRKRSV